VTPVKESPQVWPPAGKITLVAMALLSLLLYAAGLLALRQDREPGWIDEAQGPIPVAVSYLVYGTPFGAVDDNVMKQFLNPDGTTVQAQLAAAASGSIPRGPVDMYSPDASGVGMNVFATVAMASFGIAISSLVKLYLVFVGIGVVAFVLRFQDDRLIVVPLYLLVVTVMLIAPIGPAAKAIEQMPFGGQRFFVVAAILPALHIFFELIERDETATRRRTIANWLLLFVQASLFAAVLLVRSSAGYMLITLLAVLLWQIWRNRERRDRLSALAAKTGVVGAAFVLWAAFVAKELPAYVQNGRALGNVWHRSFVSFTLHPEWPFGNLRQVYDCTRYIPEGLNREHNDRNGHCVWWVYPPNQTRSVNEVMAGVYGAEYEKAMRQAFFYVATHYPRQTVELYVRYKSRRILLLLSEASRSVFAIARAPVAKVLLAIVAAQALLFVSFAVVLAAVSGAVVDRRLTIVPAFLVASFIPLYIAWANFWTAADTVVLFYFCLALAILWLVGFVMTAVSAGKKCSQERA
jgi:hypothetical protein